jgi:hypothetical protein
MPRDGAIIFRNIVGKLDVLTVEYGKCGRRGRYRLDRLIERYGIGAKLLDWEPEADCPRKAACTTLRRAVLGPVEGVVVTPCILIDEAVASPGILHCAIRRGGRNPALSVASSVALLWKTVIDATTQLAN